MVSSRLPPYLLTAGYVIQPKGTVGGVGQYSAFILPPLASGPGGSTPCPPMEFPVLATALLLVVSPHPARPFVISPFLNSPQIRIHFLLGP